MTNCFTVSRTDLRIGLTGGSEPPVIEGENPERGVKLVRMASLAAWRVRLQESKTPKGIETEDRDRSRVVLFE